MFDRLKYQIKLIVQINPIVVMAKSTVLGIRFLRIKVKHFCMGPTRSRRSRRVIWFREGSPKEGDRIIAWYKLEWELWFQGPGIPPVN